MIRIFTAAAGFAAAAALTGCSTVADMASERLGSATLSLASGVPAGTAQLWAHGNQVSLSLVLTGIEAGAHGVHLHMVGECRQPDFSSAGGHLNPLARHHGTMAAGGSHFGDLPNIAIGASGTGSMTADLPATRAQVLQWIFDADGTAVVVHAAADDYQTDPSGNSGARVACGVIKPA
ncbi:MAG: superoxide dismutase family protein [Tsuneonella sp.]